MQYADGYAVSSSTSPLDHQSADRRFRRCLGVRCMSLKCRDGVNGCPGMSGRSARQCDNLVTTNPCAEGTPCAPAIRTLLSQDFFGIAAGALRIG
jgi:hypothetical protein